MEPDRCDVSAGNVQRDGVPTLKFYFLVYEERGLWVARSVMTAHVADAATPVDAVRSLTHVIDAAIYAADRANVGAEQWYRDQPQDEPEYVSMFLDQFTGTGERPCEVAVDCSSGQCQMAIYEQQKAA